MRHNTWTKYNDNAGLTPDNPIPQTKNGCGTAIWILFLVVAIGFIGGYLVRLSYPEIMTTSKSNSDEMSIASEEDTLSVLSNKEDTAYEHMNDKTSKLYSDTVPCGLILELLDINDREEAVRRAKLHGVSTEGTTKEITHRIIQKILE